MRDIVQISEAIDIMIWFAKGTRCGDGVAAAAFAHGALEWAMGTESEFSANFQKLLDKCRGAIKEEEDGNGL